MYNRCILFKLLKPEILNKKSLFTMRKVSFLIAESPLAAPRTSLVFERADSAACLKPEELMMDGLV